MLDVFAIVALALVVVLLAVIFLLPSGPASSRAPKKDRHAEPADMKDWKAACLKLEKHVHALRAEIEQGRLREKKIERDLLIQREKFKKLQEKISQERGWQEKEATDKERKGQELIHLKEALKHTEDEVQKEHGERLKLEREMKEARESAAAATEVKRSIESQVARLTVQLDVAHKELAVLKEQNSKLSRQHDEATWVAKSEYVKLEQQLHAVEKEFTLFRSQVRRESV